MDVWVSRVDDEAQAPDERQVSRRSCVNELLEHRKVPKHESEIPVNEFRDV
jgi:hypothetical protein